MKCITIFLTLMLILCAIVTFTSLLKASPQTNRLGVSETVDPLPIPASITRNALDADETEIWSTATTEAWQGMAHAVSAYTKVGSWSSPFRKGTYTVSATLNQDWVAERNKWDGRSGQWYRSLSKRAATDDTDWFNFYDPSDTIEYCLADGYATAKDARNRAKRWSTSVYIPW